jgi:hypothetical protein
VRNLLTKPNNVYDDFFAAVRVQDKQTPRWEVLESEHHVVHILLLPDGARDLIAEGRWEELGNRYKVRFDRAHYGGGKDHYHVAKANSRKDLFAINSDGSGSHGSSGLAIPKEVAAELAKKYGDDQIRVPSNNIIEVLPPNAATALFE